MTVLQPEKPSSKDGLVAQEIVPVNRTLIQVRFPHCLSYHPHPIASNSAIAVMIARASNVTKKNA
jgi:hypothetical protein